MTEEQITFENDIKIRLQSIETQLKFFAENYKYLHQAIISGIHIQLEKQLLEPSLSHLNHSLVEFKKLLDDINKMTKEDSVAGTLQFMAKKMHQIVNDIESLNENGIKKRIHLDFTLDGHEMIKKKDKK